MADAQPTGLSANRRQLLLVGASAAALSLVLFLAWYFVLRTPMAPAFVDLRTEDAALIVEELDRHKTSYELADGGSTILVPRDQVDSSRIAVLGGDLPLRGTVGFELFSKSDMGLTEFAQKINYQRALQGELARTLMSLTNVDSARVHITLPETGVFRDDRRPAKASVTLSPKPGATIDGRAIVGVQRLVASAVEDLDPRNVVVLDSAGKPLGAPLPPTDEAEPVGTALEEAYADEIRGALAGLIDDPALRVTVRAPHDTAFAADGGAGAPDAEAARRFSLRISIAVSAPPDADLRDRIVPVLAQAIGFDARRGDTLRLIRLPSAVPGDFAPPLASTTGMPPRRSSAEPADAPAVPALAFFVTLCLAVAGGLALLRHARRRPMSAAERTSFSARLSQLLDEDERLSRERT